MYFVVNVKILQVLIFIFVARVIMREKGKEKFLQEDTKN